MEPLSYKDQSAEESAAMNPMSNEALTRDLIDEAKHESPSMSSDSGEQNPTVFVGNISKDTRERDLSDLFSAFGQVVMVSIKVSRKDGKSLGYGFVRMSSNAEATVCIEKLSGTIVCGRPLRLGWGERNRKLMIRNLPPDITIESVNLLFNGDLIEKSKTKLSLGG
jgi:RNA recognition motif-containing protein